MMRLANIVAAIVLVLVIDRERGEHPRGASMTRVRMCEIKSSLVKQVERRARKNWFGHRYIRRVYVKDVRNQSREPPRGVFVVLDVFIVVFRGPEIGFAGAASENARVAG